jgi:hypothetical protein
MSDRTISALWLITSFVGFLLAVASLYASAHTAPWDHNGGFCHHGHVGVCDPAINRPSITLVDV